VGGTKKDTGLSRATLPESLQYPDFLKQRKLFNIVQWVKAGLCNSNWNPALHSRESREAKEIQPTAQHVASSRLPPIPEKNDKGCN
jgi:hypothetical protein